MNQILYFTSTFFDTLKKYQSTILRWITAIIILKDGFSQIFNPLLSISEIKFNFISPELKLLLIIIIGVSFVILSTLLFLGINTRIISIILSLNYGLYLFTFQSTLTNFQDFGALLIIIYTIFSQSETTLDQILHSRQKSLTTTNSPTPISTIVVTTQQTLNETTQI